MDKSRAQARSHLVTIRVWQEEIKPEQTEWRGRLQVFPSGEVRYFLDWAMLVPLLLQMLSESHPER